MTLWIFSLCFLFSLCFCIFCCVFFFFNHCCNSEFLLSNRMLLNQANRKSLCSPESSANTSCTSWRCSSQVLLTWWKILKTSKLCLYCVLVATVAWDFFPFSVNKQWWTYGDDTSGNTFSSRQAFYTKM